MGVYLKCRHSGDIPERWALISRLGVAAVPWPFKIPVIGFFIASLQMLFGRFVFGRTRRRRTTYAVTDRRVMSLLRGRWRPDALDDAHRDPDHIVRRKPKACVWMASPVNLLT
jgi:hypothetical protein